MTFIFQCIWYMLPAGFANMSPVLMKFGFKKIAKPVDGGHTWHGKPILGKSKTWRGYLFAPIFGLIMFGFQQYLYQFEAIQRLSFFNYHEQTIWLGALLGAGAILGDSLKSFFKRRVNLRPGQSWIPFDQIDYTLGGLTLGAILFWPGWNVFGTVIGVGLFLHMIVNLIGYSIKLQKTKL
ncbi:MAG: CDP-archaeol synthase [Patescibacteria group bacterium]